MGSTAKTQSVFAHYVPDPLKILILEYVSLADLSRVSLCNQKLYSLVQNNSSLWARHLFKKFLNPLLRDQDCLFDEHEFSGGALVQEQDSIFQQMPEAKTVLQQHYAIKLEWIDFFGNYGLSESQRLINDVFQHIKVPQTPFPCLKRDIHHFPTNTMFQNFLTEVHFQLHAGGVRDRNSLIVEDILEKIQEESYKLSNFGNSCYKKCRQVSNKMNHKVRYQACKTKKNKINRKIVQNRDKNTTDREFIGAEKFLELVYSLIDNYCGMVWSYLTGVKEPCFLLTEYTRLWKDFVMLIIEYNQIFFPISNSLNISSSTEDKPVTIWKMMVEIWNEKVYSRLADCLTQSFCSLLGNYRCIQQTARCDPFYQDTLVVRNDAVCTTNLQEKIQIDFILKEFYQGICDLSFNDHTVFFWDCMSSSSETPKRKLDSRILAGAQAYYKIYQSLCDYNPVLVKLVFEEDARLLGDLFGNELEALINELQISCLKDSFSAFFDSTFAQAKTSLSLKMDEPNKAEILNIRRIFGIVTICKDFENELDNDLELQNAFYSSVLKNLPSFEEYFRLLSYSSERAKLNTEKRDRKKNKLLRAGFDERKGYDNKKTHLDMNRKINLIKNKCGRYNFTHLADSKQNVSAA